MKVKIKKDKNGRNILYIPDDEEVPKFSQLFYLVQGLGSLNWLDKISFK